MQIVYVAGPYRPRSRWRLIRALRVLGNVRRARAFGRAVARLGAMPLIPHSNTAFFEYGETADLPDRFWLEGTLQLLRRCDAVLAIPGWERSSGTRAEIEEARARGIPVFYSLPALAAWLSSRA